MSPGFRIRACIVHGSWMTIRGGLSLPIHTAARRWD